jgi:hypothetical protein
MGGGPQGVGDRAVGTDRGGAERLAEEEEATLRAAVPTVALGGGGVGPPAMSAGRRWSGARRLVNKEVVGWARGGTSSQASKEASGRARRRHWRLGEQGGSGGNVCTRDLVVRENGGESDKKTKEGTWRFLNPPIFIG